MRLIAWIQSVLVFDGEFQSLGGRFVRGSSCQGLARDI